ncbi:MAG TPA: UDP-N-acetylmuramoyl-tripeptide--D-alanyl-D-alanine ligase [Selenomonadales bacterium]|nr:UDP-N-acetylmuramoyl-tripeptide--D-alanyl-D-alanine ligase [Selenomonadales bacterium]
MAEFTLHDILTATGGNLIGQEFQKSFTGVSTDTRTLRAGNLFLALKGENFDGHDYLVRAVDSGAAGVIIGKKDVYVPERTTAVLVDDPLLAFQQLARFHRRRFSIPVVAITGSNGKTTTKDMIAAVLSSRLKVLKTQANYNNDVGLPLTLLNLNRQHQAAVVEMGMRAQGEIRRLAEVALPTMAVITNVGETHMEILGSLENIAAAKGELVEAVGKDGLVVLNADNPLVRAMAKRTSARVTFFGFARDASVRAENLVVSERQIAFDCVSPQGVFPVAVPAPGKHNAYNALAAVAVGLEMGLTPAEINAGMGTFLPSGMRLNVEIFGDYTVINDAYNASPMSMAAAAEALASIAKGRKVAVLGDMLELGDVAVEAHRRVGKKLAEEGIQVVVTVGELARHIAKAALDSGVDVTVACQTHDEAQEALRKLMRPGDTILIKGSRGMKMETVLTLFK